MQSVERITTLEFEVIAGLDNFVEHLFVKSRTIPYMCHPMKSFLNGK